MNKEIDRRLMPNGDSIEDFLKNIGVQTQPDISLGEVNLPKPGEVTLPSSGGATSGAKGGLGILGARGGLPIGIIGSAMGQLGYGALSGGLNSGAGSAVNIIGSTVGGALSTVNPVLGGIVSAASGIVGGGVNRLFGTSFNQERINEINKSNDALKNASFSSDSTDALMEDYDTNVKTNIFSKGDIGKAGVFAKGKLNRKYNELQAAKQLALQTATANVANSSNNILGNQVQSTLINEVAYGGPITMRYTGPMSPFGNTFAEGGGIHIKPSKRGTFTAAAKKHGKSVQAFASQVLANKENYSPAMVKKANFARNFGGRKKADGGPLSDDQYYNIMDRVAQENYRNWGFNNVDEALIHALNDNTYDYRGYYNKYPNSDANFLTHWTDEFKTVYHPTFSNESRYSGRKSQYNPQGLVGGYWKGETFVPAKWQRRKKADGGPLFTHGGIFSNGVTEINEGGTHEQNPYEGIQFGVDNQGVPNLVEEGEVIFNDYVYSNRIKAPKEVKKKYKLSGTTFADLAKNAQKESEERPNDPISQRGLQDIMAKLAMEQESLRQKDNERKMRKYAKGGKLGRLFAGPGPDPNVLLDQENPYGYVNNPGVSKGSQVYNSWDDFSYNGTKLFDTKTKRYADIYNDNRFKQWVRDNYDTLLNKYWNKDFAPTYFSKNTENPTVDQMLAGMYDQKLSDMHRFGVQALRDYRAPISIGLDDPVIPTLQESLDNADLSIKRLPTLSEMHGKKVKEGSGKEQNYATWLRYAPVLGSAIGLTHSLLSKPDYSSADAILEASRNAGKYMPVEATPIGNYLTYNPLDRDYYINKLNANTAATRRAITGQSAGNRGSAMAGLLATDYNAQTKLGELARQAAEYNFANRQAVENFNRGTNMFNSEQGLKAAMANQEAYSRAASARLSGVAQAMAMRNAIDTARNNSISANFGNLFQALGDIGREDVAASWIKDSPELYYYFTRNGRGSEYKGSDNSGKKKGNNSSKGGYITIKNKKKGGTR
jgi:hypothetical protein